MVRIAPIRLAYNPKTLWFDAGDFELNKNDAVVVTTARGTEFGRLAESVFEADDDQIKKLKSPLKPVKRLASDADAKRADDMCKRSEEALPIFKEMAAETSEDMHPVSVEFLLDGDKAVFYFEAEERVDFRELVRKLAAHFHVRIDMRQIGVRDEARMVGGLGHCGQELCCKRLGGEFCPVSIRMAKEQDLSLNPQKISGVCGRLMCCLRYEFDAYKDFKSRAPKMNAVIKTPLGSAKVVSLDVPREVISLKHDGEKPVKVPLSQFDPPEEGTRPNSVGAQAWEEATTQAAMSIMGETSFLTSQFTTTDKLANPGDVRRSGTGGKGTATSRANGAKKSNTPVEAAPAPEARKPRRRRSTKVSADGTTQSVVVNEGGAKRSTKQAEGEGAPKRRSSRKPAPAAEKRSNTGERKGGSTAQGNTNAKSQAGAKGKQGARPGAKQNAKQGPRPGQRSSGLRQRSAPQGAQSGATPPGEGTSSAQNTQRRSRRRSHKAGGNEGQAGSTPSSAPRND